jgi:alkanesulfonate monooxygenase SsuD/methylene tetrahydromethanopterin reductase-like flavin-dependent oxidoreductase (luciferase family)
MNFAAIVAEVIFAAQSRRDEATRFRAAMHAKMRDLGRPPRALKILPGLSPILGATEAEARRKEQELDDLVLPAVGVWMLSEQLKFRLYEEAPDAPLPVAAIRAAGSNFTPRVASLLDRAEAEKLSIRACAMEVARSRSHGSFVGTPEQLADHMQLWLDDGACDGFNIMPAYFPDELDVFVNEAMPVLQQRGLFRTEYEGATLRDHLGLPKPPRGRRR